MAVRSGSVKMEETPVLNVQAIRTENLSEAKLINEEQLEELLKKLEPIEANEERLDIIDEEKTPYLFSSEYLIRMINEITPSVKTRVLIISLIGPRLTDPRARMQDIVAMFRFSEEKQLVEEIIKARANQMNSSTFSAVGGIALGGVKGRGGAGRGTAGGRTGAGRGPPKTTTTNGGGSVTTEKREEGDSDSPGSLQVDSPGSASATSTEQLSPKDSSGNEAHLLLDEPFEVIKIEARQATIVVEAKKNRFSSAVGNTSTSHVNSINTSREPSRASSPCGSVNGWHIKTAKLGGLSPSISNLSSLTLSTLGTVGTANMKIKNTQRVASAPPRENKVASLWLDREKSINGRVESPAKECTVGKVGKLKPSIFERRPTLTSSDSKDSKTPLTPPFLRKTIASHASFDSSGSGSRSSTPDPRSIGLASSSASTSHSPYASSSVMSSPVQSNISKCAAALNITVADFLCLQEEGPRVLGEDEEVSLEGDESFEGASSRSGSGIGNGSDSGSESDKRRKDIGGKKDKYSYRELVRRNFAKEYGKLVQSGLEIYLLDEEFLVAFNKTKEEFYAQPRWKQIAQKKMAMLF